MLIEKKSITMVANILYLWTRELKYFRLISWSYANFGFRFHYYG